MRRSPAHSRFFSFVVVPIAVVFLNTVGAVLFLIYWAVP